MFKRLFKGNNNHEFKRRVKSVFKRQPREIVPRPRPAKPSIIGIFYNKIKKSNIKMRDIELLDGMDAKKIKKHFSVTGSKAKVLEKLAADYNRGKLSLPGSSHESKYDAKSLNKEKLNKMIKQYDARGRDGNNKEAKKNAAILKKRFNMTASEASDLENVLVAVNRAKGSHVDLLKKMLDPKTLTPERVEKFTRQYEEAERKNRGLSYLITKSNLSFAGPKRKVSNLMEDVKAFRRLSGVIRKYQ